MKYIISNNNKKAFDPDISFLQFNHCLLIFNKFFICNNMVNSFTILVLFAAVVAVCLASEKEESSLLKKLTAETTENINRNKRALYYRNDPEAMARERNFRNGDLGFYDYYYDDLYDYYYDYYYDYPLYYGFGPLGLNGLGLGIGSPFGIGLDRFNRNNKGRESKGDKRGKSGKRGSGRRGERY
ncbi:unnamed protein product [Brachionus calyciflorus]|uniref:Uncharacterized protein n=1 Tax=Brachionus calyciflorus TaxID=104777 RepID=A0A813ZVG9_9BILA|nr:unnamed protein product [Brachionus calyciflorus]